MRRVHVIVAGSVQGVGYRYTMRLVAREAGAAGWVRNLRDGRVEAEVEGTPAQVDEVLAWMAQGPPGASVLTARVTDAAPTGALGFEVRRDG
jgi:acylphosphatase